MLLWPNNAAEDSATSPEEVEIDVMQQKVKDENNTLTRIGISSSSKVEYKRCLLNEKNVAARLRALMRLRRLRRLREAEGPSANALEIMPGLNGEHVVREHEQATAHRCAV